MHWSETLLSISAETPAGTEVMAEVYLKSIPQSTFHGSPLPILPPGSSLIVKGAPQLCLHEPAGHSCSMKGCFHLLRTLDPFPREDRAQPPNYRLGPINQKSMLE